jgi:hypothetical protein
MPKKTKREKMIAELRRHSLSPQVAHPVFAFQSSAKNTASLQSNIEELTIIRHDLIRTIILALIAVGIELTIYWKISVK